MKTLLLDNYDSFTHNLFQLLAEVNGAEPTVVRNDEARWGELAGMGFDNVVVSPGPGRPDHDPDFGVCAEAIAATDLPLLGVCLGHQGICTALGGRVVHAEPMHGRESAVFHDGSPLFDGIPREFRAIRYHSLCAEEPLPSELRTTAWTSDGVVMGLEHRSRPLWGVQFHPESVSTEHGRRLLTNFRDLTCAALARGGGPKHPRPTGPSRAGERPAFHAPQGRLGRSPDEGLEIHVERLDELHDPEIVFCHLYGDCSNAFWLDSSRVGEGARFSFVGSDEGPLGALVTYDVLRGELRVERNGETEVRRESIFDYLDREAARLRPLPTELPFDFACGFAGYFGYELKAECGGDLAHTSPLPDAAFVLAGRMIAFDHLERRTYLLCATEREAGGEAERWLTETRRRLEALPRDLPGSPEPGANQGGSAEPEPLLDAPVDFHLSRSRERYLEDIERCKRHLADGDTYEVCLTDKLTAEASPDPLPLYRELRRINPAPFSAYLRLGDMAVLSSSPERFLRVGRDRRVEAKPIKGTCRRGADAAEDARLAEGLRTGEKDRAENLTITDLLRNDLGRVCEVGTVHVPHLMQVESYETVHQLVSTVRGLLREGVGPAECVRACFPGGSMTGAPKRRTMEIIDALEGEARGPYSGAIGYLGLGGACDLSIVIRTIVLDGESASIGVGGAIVAQSDPEAEVEEILLKGLAPMRAFDPAADPGAAARRASTSRSG